ncbi:tail protein [Providencia phage PSTCR4]|uniref:Uncharacterized protein n=1 Tax=Providencia phage PSTCR4 TaxID=2783546 RepID=A0A873WPY5_9CAUD|nr:tail protein [Providencia phage PSTCR4]QPB12055.1 hypothetical protein [Providencia phage PSTCR4]
MLFSPFSDAMIDAMEKDHVTMVIAAKAEFKSGTTYIHSGTGPLVLSLDGISETYLGTGEIGKLGSVTEQNNASPTKMSFGLSGLNNTLLAKVMTERCVGVDVTVYLVVLDEHYNVAAYNLLYKGFISDSAITSGKNSGISFVVSNIFEKWAYGLSDRFTDQSQRQRNDGDAVFRYVSQMSDRSLFWGSKKDAPPLRYE